MRKEIKVVDEKRNIVQITTTDERWYTFESRDKKSGLPQHQFIPSVTWICEHYPKGIAFYKWLASKGWDEAEAIKIAAGDRGGKVHYAIGDLLDGNEVRIDSEYMNKTIGQPEELTVSEYAAVLSFVEWYKETKPVILAREFVIINAKEQYAGTVDLLCLINGKLWIIDIKTSQYIWPSHELQVSAYKRGDNPLLEKIDMPKAKLGILQVGYRKNKYKKYKFTEVKDCYDEFLAAKVIWAKETNGVQPRQKDYPLSVQISIPTKESEAKDELPSNTERKRTVNQHGGGDNGV